MKISHDHQIALGASCPVCAAPPGVPCTPDLVDPTPPLEQPGPVTHACRLSYSVIMLTASGGEIGSAADYMTPDRKAGEAVSVAMAATELALALVSMATTDTTQRKHLHAAVRSMEQVWSNYRRQ